MKKKNINWNDAIAVRRCELQWYYMSCHWSINCLILWNHQDNRCGIRPEFGDFMTRLFSTVIILSPIIWLWIALLYSCANLIYSHRGIKRLAQHSESEFANRRKYFGRPVISAEFIEQPDHANLEFPFYAKTYPKFMYATKKWKSNTIWHLDSIIEHNKNQIDHQTGTKLMGNI